MINQRNACRTKIRFKFYKKDEFKYLSHLDITRIIMRALRRAELKIEYSLGYNPKPRIVFSPPTPLGIESLAEYSDVLINENISGQGFKKKVNLQLKSQMQVIKARKTAIETANLMNDVAVSLYIFGLESCYSDRGILEEFYKTMENDLKKSDFSRAIYDLGIEQGRTGSHIFFLKLFGYAKIFKEDNNEFFKFNDFYKYFTSWLKDYRIGVREVKKEELFVLRENMLKTPMDVV
jgi:radical SAM-linked protein